MHHISHLSSAEARRLWECLMDPPAVHILWENLTALLCDLFGTERTNLFLVIPEKQQLRTRAASEFQWDIVLDWNEGIAGHVYQSQKPLLIDDIRGSEFSHYFNRDPDGFKTRSMLTVPVFCDGDESQAVVALIQLVNKIDENFDMQDLEALKYWARQIGVTLERSHGTEIWRHPESEPPILGDPEFGTILPKLSAEQIAYTLAYSVATAIAEWREYHLQSQNMTHTRSLWESRELLKMVRDECRHTHIIGQLSREVSKNQECLSYCHKLCAKLLKLMGIVTRDPTLRYLMGSYHEWFGFYSSSFLYRLYEGMPRERNLLHSVVEDERSHSTFFESRLLDHMIHHPQRRYKLKLFQRIAQFFYSRMAKRMIQPLVPLSRRPELPGRFAELFRGFTDHRMESLSETAELRAPTPVRWRSWITAHLYGIASILSHAFIALFLFPFAILWPTQGLSKEYEEEVRTLLEPSRVPL